jgi:hypothetical protein
MHNRIIGVFRMVSCVDLCREAVITDVLPYISLRFSMKCLAVITAFTSSITNVLLILSTCL